MGGSIMEITLDKETSNILTRVIEKRCREYGHSYELLPDWLLKKHPEDKGKSFCTCCGREA